MQFLKTTISGLQIAYFTILLLLGGTAVYFYIYQNFMNGVGGGIALPKLLWLAYALWFWYFLPSLVICDRRLAPKSRQIYGIFLGNMIVRAIVELWMMYGPKNWHPYYGIAHDLFSAVLVFGLLIWWSWSRSEATTSSPGDRPDQGNSQQLTDTVRLNFQVMGVMFLIESYFAWYMLQNVRSESGPVYFVPGSSDYADILILTWLVVLALTGQQIMFAWQWLGDRLSSSNF
ncbi:MAG: hypothetical protein D6680_12215 [Cyanobacteria bacterium J007]|nr:MAG: hypothetical protein D6680_12215 [Cyanobacteria bacterium J007]